MKSSEFASKFKSRYLWWNIIAMIVVVVVICLGVKFGLDVYTHHGESISVPDIRHKSFADAEQILDNMGLKIEVSDTGYVKNQPPDCILAQTPGTGVVVKSGKTIYVTINSPNSPTITLPDVIDNSSLREAMAKLTSMGFKVGTPQYISGEKDWVYGITANGKHVSTGDKISVDSTLIIQVGNGLSDDSDSITDVEPPTTDNNGNVDEFEEVKTPDASTSSKSSETSTSKDKTE